MNVQEYQSRIEALEARLDELEKRNKKQGEDLETLLNSIVENSRIFREETQALYTKEYQKSAS